MILRAAHNDVTVEAQRSALFRHVSLGTRFKQIATGDYTTVAGSKISWKERPRMSDTSCSCLAKVVDFQVSLLNTKLSFAYVDCLS